MNMLQGEKLLRHLERYLGLQKKRWLSSKDKAEFQVLFFPEQPNQNSQCFVTFGLSAFKLNLNGHAINHKEFLICTDNSFDPNAIAALLIAVGIEAIERSFTPNIHDILLGSGAVLRNPIFEHLYLTFPGYFDSEFELCNTVSPPIVIGQLIPISTREREIIIKHGWRTFENTIVDQNIDLLAFDNRKEVTFPS